EAAFGGPVQAAQDVEEGRLARARGDHDGHVLAGMDGQVDAPEGRHGRLALTVDPGDPFHPDDLPGLPGGLRHLLLRGCRSRDGARHGSTSPTGMACTGVPSCSILRMARGPTTTVSPSPRPAMTSAWVVDTRPVSTGRKRTVWPSSTKTPLLPSRTVRAARGSTRTSARRSPVMVTEADMPGRSRCWGLGTRTQTSKWATLPSRRAVGDTRTTSPAKVCSG